MSGTFAIWLVVALAAVMFWRITLVLAIAAVIALMATGVSGIRDKINEQGSSHGPVTPATPGQLIPGAMTGCAATDTCVRPATRGPAGNSAIAPRGPDTGRTT